MTDDAAAVTGAFVHRETDALFATELRSAVRPQIDAARFESVLADMERRGIVRIARKSAPDPHLADADLRIVALARDGDDAAIEAAWRGWIGEFLRSHRCT